MNRIRELREDRDLRQIDVSNATGIDQKTLSNYETGKTSPDSFALIALADFFNVTIDYLVGRVDINDYDKLKKCDTLIKLCDEITTIANELK